MNKIVSTKRTSAIFLATVLIAGTITALSAPSFMMIGAEAQAQPYYGMDDSYGYSDYRMDNDKKSYDKKSYRNDNSYGSQYQPSYKPDYYKPAYSSYGKDDSRDKSKDSKSVSINKLKCINTNLNINGNNTGDINLGNKGQGYVGSYSSDGSGYYDGYNNNKQGKGFECIINNNNNNIVMVGGNGTTPEPLTCEECFTENLTVEQLNNIIDELPQIFERGFNLEDFCEFLSNSTITNQPKLGELIEVFAEAGITDEDTVLRVIECLEELELIILPPGFELPPIFM